MSLISTHANMLIPGILANTKNRVFTFLLGIVIERHDSSTYILIEKYLKVLILWIPRVNILWLPFENRVFGSNFEVFKISTKLIKSNITFAGCKVTSSSKQSSQLWGGSVPGLRWVSVGQRPGALPLLPWAPCTATLYYMCSLKSHFWCSESVQSRKRGTKLSLNAFLSAWTHLLDCAWNREPSYKR